MTFWHFGYIDPGSGSLLLQVIFGGILGFMYVARGSWPGSEISLAR